MRVSDSRYLCRQQFYQPDCVTLKVHQIEHSLGNPVIGPPPISVSIPPPDLIHFYAAAPVTVSAIVGVGVSGGQEGRVVERSQRVENPATVMQSWLVSIGETSGC